MIIYGITFSTFDMWLLGICGTLILLLLTLRLKSESKRKDVFNEAAKEFVAIFHRELREVYPIPGNWPDNIDQYLRERFDRLSEAVGIFQRYLTKRKRVEFSDAWFSFYCCTGREIDKDCQCYHHYMPFIGSSIENGVETFTDTTKTYKDTFKHNINHLLSFAEIK